MRVTGPRCACGIRCAPVERLLIAVLAGAMLLTGFTGHAGQQLLDQALLAKLVRTHYHGVPGEAAYIAQHGTWEGSVHSHCHPPQEHGASHIGPDEVQGPSSLAGAAACLANTITPLPPEISFSHDRTTAAAGERQAPSPPLRPPRS